MVVMNAETISIKENIFYILHLYVVLVPGQVQQVDDNTTTAVKFAVFSSFFFF